MIRRSLTVFLLCLSSVGCIPLPHLASSTPLIEGWLVRDGGAAPDLPVRAVKGPATGTDAAPCTGRFIETASDQDGRFVLAPIRRRDFFVFVVPAHSSFEWHLCIRDGDAWKVVNESRDYTLTDSGPWWISEIRCELAQGTPLPRGADHRRSAGAGRGAAATGGTVRSGRVT